MDSAWSGAPRDTKNSNSSLSCLPRGKFQSASPEMMQGQSPESVTIRAFEQELHNIALKIPESITGSLMQEQQQQQQQGCRINHSGENPCHNTHSQAVGEGNGFFLCRNHDFGAVSGNGSDVPAAKAELSLPCHIPFPPPPFQGLGGKEQPHSFPPQVGQRCKCSTANNCDHRVTIPFQDPSRTSRPPNRCRRAKAGREPQWPRSLTP